MCVTDYTCRLLFICKYTDTFFSLCPIKNDSHPRSLTMAQWNAYYQNDEEEEEQEDGEQFRGKLGHFLYSTLIFTIISVISTLLDYIFHLCGGVQCFYLIAYQKRRSTQTEIKFSLYYQITKSQGETVWCFWWMHPKKCLSKEKMASPPTLTSACR